MTVYVTYNLINLDRSPKGVFQPRVAYTVNRWGLINAGKLIYISPFSYDKQSFAVSSERKSGSTIDKGTYRGSGDKRPLVPA